MKRATKKSQLMPAKKIPKPPLKKANSRAASSPVLAESSAASAENVGTNVGTATPTHSPTQTENISRPVVRARAKADRARAASAQSATDAPTIARGASATPRGDWPLAQIEKRAVSSLRAYERNARTHTDEQINQIAASLSEWGWTMPVLIDESGMIIAGHARVQAAPRAGYADVPVIVARGWTDAQKRAYVLADNRLAMSAGWDSDLLHLEVSELKLAGFDLNLMGFDSLELKNMLEFGGKPGASQDEVIVPPQNPVSQRGDLWELGNHRLMCGDSTNVADVARLMDGDKTALFSSDPPYSVDYTGDNRPIHKGKASGKDWSNVYKEIEIKDFDAFFDGLFAAWNPYCVDGVAIYIWHAHVLQGELHAAFLRAGYLPHQCIVWKKPCATFTHAFFRQGHDPCLFGWRQGHKPKHGVQQLTTIWECDWDGKKRVTDNQHPTQKPTQIFELPIELHTKPGDVVIEPFSGSGSNLIAAEKLSRKCRAMEISPAFVDVGVVRWERYTGKVARLAGDGRSFKEIATLRGITPIDPATQADESESEEVGAGATVAAEVGE